MKKQIFTLVILAALFCSSTHATIWRVNGNPNIDADFSSLQTAVGSPYVYLNDTVYVEGFGSSYGNITLSKPLVLIGPGFFLDQNDTTQAIKQEAILSKVTFAAGSEGSVLTGFYVQGEVVIQTDGITVTRNRVRRLDASTNIPAITVNNSGASLTTIDGNHVYVKNTGGTSGVHAYGLRCINKCNIVIKNNYFIAETANASADRRAIWLQADNSSNQAIIYNNVFSGVILSYYGIYYNNISITGVSIGSNNLYEFNIGSEDQYPVGNGNQQYVNMLTVFVDPFSGIDNGLELLPGSPAVGAGMNGVDCGIFGGNAPYVLSGIPAVPSIFEFDYTGVSSQSVPIQVHMKVKSNK